VLTPAQLAFLAAVQDRLIPSESDSSAGQGRMLPGAGESGAAERVDSLLAERPAWRPDLLAALQAIDVAAQRLVDVRSVQRADGDAAAASFRHLSDDERDAVLREVEGTHPRLFRRLLRLTYTAYYTDTAVQRAHGYAFQPPLPGGYALPPFDESRLDSVKRRGKLWRDA
jgi:hypothetical protein